MSTWSWPTAPASRAHSAVARHVRPPLPAAAIVGRERTGRRAARGPPAHEGGQGPGGRVAAGHRPPGRGRPRPRQRSAGPPPGRATLGTGHEGVGEPALGLPGHRRTECPRPLGHHRRARRRSGPGSVEHRLRPRLRRTDCRRHARSTSETTRPSGPPTSETASRRNERPPRGRPRRPPRDRQTERAHDRPAARSARPRRPVRALAGALRSLVRRRSRDGPRRPGRQRSGQEHAGAGHFGPRAAERGSRDVRREGHHRATRPSHPPAGTDLHPRRARHLSRPLRDRQPADGRGPGTAIRTHGRHRPGRRPLSGARQAHWTTRREPVRGRTADAGARPRRSPSLPS